MASTKYTGVSKDKSTGKYMYYFKAGVDLATGKPYQKRLGHADVKTTLSVYSHLYPNADTEITSKLETLFTDFIPHNDL